MRERQTQIEWRDGRVPVSVTFDDPYFSLDSGLDETRHVFLSGNDLPARFKDGFRIAELGFGTGLNFAAALDLWRRAGCEGRFAFTTFEAFPLPTEEAGRAMSAFAEVAHLIGAVSEAVGRGDYCVTGPDFDFELVLGDANETLPDWSGVADAWFLDGFSPAKNPQMWSVPLMREVGRHTAPKGTAATYTAAGHVRRALQDAGFDVERRPGFGRKRHMTVARWAH